MTANNIEDQPVDPVAQIASLRADLASAQRRIALLEEGLAEARAGRFAPTSPAGFPQIARGERLYFSDRGDGAILLASGWHPREPWGTWGAGGDQVLRFSLGDDYAGGYVHVSMDIQCLATDDGDRPVVDIIANGYFITRLTLSGLLRSYNVRLPPICLGEGDVALSLVMADPMSADAIFGNGDDRILGIGLASIQID